MQCFRCDLYHGSHDRSSQVDAVIFICTRVFFLVNGLPPVQCYLDQSYLTIPSVISSYNTSYMLVMDVRDGCTQILYVQHILSGYIKSRSLKVNSRISVYWEAY